jgi:hypothetical protein
VRLSAFGLLVAAAAAAAPAFMSVEHAAAAEDYRLDWAIPRGFTLRADTQGYVLPTSIAFVKNPGDAANSPLYFVSELGGTIKVVTRDRTVRTFATIVVPRLSEKFPALNAQTGIGGLCLDDEHGYVFATYAIFDRQGVLRNHLARYATHPRSFALRPTARLDLSQIFTPYPTVPNHQIGGCAVTQRSLFVTMGDATVSRRSHDVEDLAGKVVRMTLDGAPHPANPFRQGPTSRYVWAMGLRNPFGITVAEGDIFVTENGIDIDSFLRIHRGVDYGWNGTDPTIAMNAEAVIVPSVGPAQLAFDAAGVPGFPASYARQFFFATSTTSAERGAGVMTLKYDFASKRVVSPPASFIRFTRPVGGESAAVAIGPDGLYFAGLVPNRAGDSPVYRVSYDPSARYPNVLEIVSAGSRLYFQNGCNECHTRAGIGGKSAPVLDREPLEERLSHRLGSEDYKRRIAQLNRRTDEPFRSFRAARRRVLAAEGEDRLALWIKYRLLQPRFDDPNAAMPDPGMSPREATRLANYLVGRGPKRANVGLDRGFFTRARDAVKSKRFAAGFAGGLIVAGVALVLVVGATRLRRHPRSR